MKIKQIDIVCHSHYDLCGADHASVVSLLSRRYTDAALSLIEETKDNPPGERFCWTAESCAPLLEWWSDASPDKRRKLLEAIDSGSFDVGALPYNFSSLLGEDVLGKAVNWLSEELFGALKIKTAIQSGTDGISAAAVRDLALKGIRYVWILPPENGAFLRAYPLLFNWKITATEHVLAYENGIYGSFYDMLFKEDTPDPFIGASDLSFREPDEKDIFRVTDKDGEPDKKYVAEAYVRLSSYLEKTAAGGEYSFSTLPVSFVNRRRGVNDPPAGELIPFVRLWNSMGFVPRLNITTASAALASLETEASVSRIPTYSGQWQDTFSKRFMSSPSIMSVAAKTEQLFRQQQALPGADIPSENKLREFILRDLCCFYEHSSTVYSASRPYNALMTDSAKTVKNAFVYRAYARAEYMFAEKLRKYVSPSEDGVYVYNPTPYRMSGRVVVPESSLRGTYVSVMDSDSLDIQELNVSKSNRYPGNEAAFWADVPAYGVKLFTMMNLASPENTYTEPPVTETDLNGWPLSVKYKDGQQIKAYNIGDIIAVAPKGGRRAARVLLTAAEEDKENIRNSIVNPEAAAYEIAVTSDSDRYITVTQSFTHAVFGGGKRIMTIWKDEPRVNIRIILDKLPETLPCAVYAKFSLAISDASPVTSNGGMVFEPGRGILPGCRLDCISTDGWVSYPYVKLLWFSADTPFVSFGDICFYEDSREFTQNKGCLYALLFDDTEAENICPDAWGCFEYSFDLLCDEHPDDFPRVKKLTEKCFSSLVPVVYIH